MRKIALVGALSLLHLALASGHVSAYSSGIYDMARPSAGCTCHGGVIPPNTVTQLVIDGLPEAYTPGETYELTLWVLGAGVPTGPTFANAFFGFNLEATAGPLEKVDDRAQVTVASECDLVTSTRSCDRSTTCGVKGEDFCKTTSECFQKRCSSPGEGDCRLCSEEIVYIQATHSAAGGTAPAELLTDGNNLPMWNLRWTAPAAGTGDVTFFMAGNAVNGGGSNDPGDNWSVLDPPIVVAEQ